MKDDANKIMDAIDQIAQKRAETFVKETLVPGSDDRLGEYGSSVFRIGYKSAIDDFMKDINLAKFVKRLGKHLKE